MDDYAGSIGAILVAAGRGSRFGRDHNKVFSELHGEPLWFHAARRLRQHAYVGALVIVIAEADQAHWEEEACRRRLEGLGARTVLGGAQRTDSVRAGLAGLPESECRWVAIHDAARPWVPQEDLSSVFQAAIETDAAILAKMVTGSIKRSDRNGRIAQSVNRNQLWEALTPQVFAWQVLQHAFARWQGRPVTDDAQLVELAGTVVKLVPGDAANLKVTGPSDLRLAEAILRAQ